MKDIPIILLAGIAATGVMILFMNEVANRLRKPYQVVRLLGTMLTNKQNKIDYLSGSFVARFTGTLVHYLIGILFAYIYFRWMSSIVNVAVASFAAAAIFATLGCAGWKLFFLIHRNPPRIDLAEFLLYIFIAHFVLTAGYFITFSAAMKAVPF